MGNWISQWFGGPTIQTVEESNWNRPHELLYNIELKEEQIILLENFKMGENLKICFFKSKTFPEYQQFCIMNNSWVMQFGKEAEILDNLRNLTPSSKLKICIISLRKSQIVAHYKDLFEMNLKKFFIYFLPSYGIVDIQ